jgi:hypothetical protein
MDTGAGAIVDISADGYMVFVHIADGKVLRDHPVHPSLQLSKIHIGAGILKIHTKPVAHIIVTAQGGKLRTKAKFAQILSGVCHEPVGEGCVGLLPDFLRLRTENIGTGYNNLLANTNEQIRVDIEEGIHQIKMLHNHPLALVEGLGDGIGQNAHLGKAVFKADIQMVGVRGEKGDILLYVQNRQRADINAMIVIGQLQTGKHTPYQSAFSGTGFADNTDQFVIWG